MNDATEKMFKFLHEKISVEFSWILKQINVANEQSSGFSAETSFFAATENHVEH